MKPLPKEFQFKCDENSLEQKLKSEGYIFKQIKDYPSYFITDCGMVYSMKSNRFLKNYLCYGYYYVQLHNGNGYKNFKISRLVAIHFIDNPKNKPEVNHIDGVKTNNHISNLEWCTGSENIKHAFAKGLIVKSEKQKESVRQMGKRNSGGNHPSAKKVIDKATGILYNTIIEASNHLGVHKRTLAYQLNGKCQNKTNLEFYKD